jgi:molecular chaperone GrpE (heat shock protein)
MIYSLEVAKKKEYQHDFESLTKALEAYEGSKRKAAATIPQSTVTSLLESIDNLKDAEKLVRSLSLAIGHYDPKLPQNMRTSLDYLTDFDDSE